MNGVSVVTTLPAPPDSAVFHLAQYRKRRPRYGFQDMLHEPPVLYSVDLQGCTTMPALSPRTVEATFVNALEAAGATVVQSVSHNFPGTGLTCVLILAESHAVLHTWPESGTAHIDIFSCSTRLKSLAAIKEVSRCFGAAHLSLREIPRADGHHAPPDERR